MRESTRTVAIVGAGPVGLAAAAHALERGLTPIVLEAGPEIGHAMRQWSHVQLFSPWQYNVDAAAARLLAPTGWNSPDPAIYPTGGELLERYLEPPRHPNEAARSYPHLEPRHRHQPRRFRQAQNRGPRCRAVRTALSEWPGSGLGSGRCGNRCVRHMAVAQSRRRQRPCRHGRERSRRPRRLRDARRAGGAIRARYAGKTVAVLGAGHSAIGTLTDLARLRQDAPGTEAVWLLRGADPAKAFGGGANDKLAARGELGAAFAALVAAGAIRVETGFPVTHIDRDGARLRVASGAARPGRHVVVDELIVATGFRPDFSFARELRIQLDAAIECPVALAPLIDPNEHSCGTVRPHGARELQLAEPGYYIAGMKSYGRAPTFLMITGYEQVRSIAADIAGDHAAAARVELELPETGVCSRGAAPEAEPCCGATAAVAVSSCCGSSTTAQQPEQAGCGCP